MDRHVDYRELTLRRDTLSKNLLVHQDAINIIQSDWIVARIWITNWWKAYKAWESQDTFNAAVLDDRMTMRSFGSTFSREVNKQFTPLTIATPTRFFADSQYTKLSPDQRSLHDTRFKEVAAQPASMYTAKRGINGTAFANPANFQTRALKYEHGLHDLSVKLLVKNSDVKAQSHHRGEANPHFAFLPLSKGEDQEVIYKLTQYAKALRPQLPDLYQLIRDYRAKMTRVKLASDYDMGTGYRAIPLANSPDGLPYKVSYSLGSNIKVRGSALPVPTTVDTMRERQQAYFEHRSDIARTGNEIVIAMRQHASGRFPVYAQYDGTELKCFDIDQDNNKVFNGKTISLLGRANF